jgi:hypothetical protein
MRKQQLTADKPCLQPLSCGPAAQEHEADGGRLWTELQRVGGRRRSESTELWEMATHSRSSPHTRQRARGRSRADVSHCVPCTPSRGTHCLGGRKSCAAGRQAASGAPLAR